MIQNEVHYLLDSGTHLELPTVIQKRIYDLRLHQAQDAPVVYILPASQAVLGQIQLAFLLPSKIRHFPLGQRFGEEGCLFL